MSLTGQKGLGMFFRDLTPKKGAIFDVILAEAYLPVRVGQDTAEQLYAAPLNAQLQATGRGTVMSCEERRRTDGTMIGIDLYLGLRDGSQDSLQTVAHMLEHLTAPCGSSLQLSDSFAEPLIFGEMEGLEIYFDPAIAPDAQARQNFFRTCEKAVRSIAISRGWDACQDKTHFYFYGEDYEAMRKTIAPILDNHPIYRSALLRRLS